MKKKFYQKKWFIGLVIVFVLSMIFGTSETENNTENDTQIEQNTNDTEKELANGEQFIEDVKIAIQDDISTDDEKITDVTLTDKELRVFVDLSKKDPAPFTLEDIVIIRTSSITDAILDLTECMDLWDTIVVDFGDLGSISNKKEEMVQNEYGMYYFPTENFELEK